MFNHQLITFFLGITMNYHTKLINSSYTKISPNAYENGIA